MPEFSGKPSSSEPELIDPEEFPKWVVAEDASILALNKPGLVVCHPSKNGPWSSLIGAAREYLGQEVVHLVHRLDRETSGICLLAKHKLAARHSQMAFQHGQVRKEYLALLEGELPEPVLVSNHLAKDLDSAVYIKQTVRKSHSSKRAETEFRPILSRNGYTLVEVLPKTGRKHQIRVHALHLGFPIVGDKLYGADENYYLEFIEFGYTAKLAEAIGFHRHALHAARIHFRAPLFQRSFFAPLQPDLLHLIVTKLGCTGEDLEKLLLWDEDED